MQHLNIKLNYKILSIFIAFIEEKYSKSSEITFLHASLNRKGQYIDLCYDRKIFLILEMRGVIPKNEITEAKILSVDIFIIAIKNNAQENQTCYTLFPLQDYESLYQINYLYSYWFCFQLSIKGSVQFYNDINTSQFLRGVIYNCIFKQVFLDYIRYDLQKFKDYILCQRRLYLFLILHNAEHDFFLTEGINLGPTYVNWLRKLKNYKCILQSKVFTTFIEKHRKFEIFKMHKTHCFTILESFCQIYPFCKEINKSIDNHMKIFYFFQKADEITPDDVSGKIFKEKEVFFKNLKNENTVKDSIHLTSNNF
ncbi:hypothetical protein COBT_001405 [Conglomerata obtusa]